MNLTFRLVLAGAALLILFVPAWWVAGRLQERRTRPFFQGLFAVGLALVGYVSFVNLLGRLLSQSITPALLYLGLNAAATGILWFRRPRELRVSPLIRSWRAWSGAVALAALLGLPQWVAAVSTPYWDEVASSAIHLSAPNQFAENLFPPRHNALPDVRIKYHYGFTILSGTVRWLTGLSANVSIDVASTMLWLFAFLFVCFWLRELDFDRVSATWGGFAVLFGGGLDWLYMSSTEAYSGNEKVPPASELLHRYDGAKSWLDNLIAVGQVPSAHLRNADGSLSNLPWDIAAQFQQHAVAMGIALTLVALYLFVLWQRKQNLHVPLLAANIVTFGVLFLAHAVFGGVAAVTAAICLLASWLSQRTRVRFYRGLAFGVGLAVLAPLHGGLLAVGSEYGASSDLLTLRGGFGYSSGGVPGFLHWNLAGFGLPLVLAVVAGAVHVWHHDRLAVERNLVVSVLAVFAVFSYVVPNLAFYSSDAIGVEEFNEILKFFFCAHLAMALLSVFAVARIVRAVDWTATLPGFVAMAITPLAFCYGSSFDARHAWLGFYRAPYFRQSVEQQMAETLQRLKKSAQDVYYDASDDERRHDYLSEMLVFAGSVFTMTPSRYEQTGIGYRLSEEVVAKRFAENARMWRLLPGAAEAARCGWYYARPLEDRTLAPLIVRSRFDKLVAENYLVTRLAVGPRVLYSIDKPTADLDQGIEKYWRPRIVTQARTDTDGDGGSDLVFYDYPARQILAGATRIALPPWLQSEFVPLYVGTFRGDAAADFLFGRVKDTDYGRGKKIADLVIESRWAWTYRDSATGVWQPEYDQWQTNFDIPVIADLDHDGFDSHIAFRPRTGGWMLSGNRTISGPIVDQRETPVPFGGRFLEGSAGDLGLWALKTGTVTLKSVAGGQQATFKWGGQPGDVLVPGDYTGDGYDEMAVWQRSNHTWYWRRAPDGAVTEAIFGSDTGVPLPWDYNHDGQLDLASWEAAEGKIYVSFTQGRSVDLVVPVPPNTLPAFVNMF